MNTTSDYIILGGGIIGMMLARELAIKGAEVTILDRKKLGAEASWSAGGILSSMRPWSENPASFSLSEYGKKLYPDCVNGLKMESGIDPQFIQSGLIVIGEEHTRKICDWAVHNGIDCIKNVKNINQSINLPKHAILLPSIYQIRPPLLLEALHKSLQHYSVNIFEDTEVTNIKIKNNQFQYVETEKNRFHADVVIITAGAWSKVILGKHGKYIDVKPILGQMICLKLKENNLENIILDDNHYMIPRVDNHLLVGSTMEDVGFNKKTTSSAKQELLGWASSIWPETHCAELVSHWSGLRPATVSGKPLICKAPEINGVYMNTGHFRKGILQAPSSARLMADYLYGNDLFMNIENFAMPISDNALKVTS